jgi:hypothetical protein
MIRAIVTFGERDKTNPAMPMCFVVPTDKAMNPGSGFFEALERFRGISRRIF